jgi:predicted ATP-grasp superfamily ATP-dependent carboligase
MERAIVLGAGYGAIGVMRALALEGIQVTLLYADPHEHACYSRFASEKIQITNPMDDGADLLEVLMQAKNWDGALLIPTLDEYIIFISKNCAELRKKYCFTLPGWEQTRQIILKDLLYMHAREINVPTPRFFLPDNLEDFRECKDDFCYPLILKPCQTHKFDRIYGRKNLIAHDFQELTAHFADTQRRGLKMLLSEIIPGADSAIFTYRSYLDCPGNILGEMCTQKLRQYPTCFGQGAVVRSIPMLPEIRSQALMLLHSLGYHGESSTEFKLDYRDQQYKLMEINVRPVVTEWLFVKAGLNFPYITYLDAVKDVRKDPPTYKPELYWIHLYWDAINFVEFLKSGKLKLKEFLQPYSKEKVFVLPLFDDPLHFLLETYFNLGRALIKFVRTRLKLKKSAAG